MDILDNDPNQKFDILNYLNDIYMHKMASRIDVTKAGGHHNIHDNENTKAEEEIMEINKKRIHIPNAQIKYFSHQQQRDVEEYNEPETSSSTKQRTRKSRARHNKVSDEGEQEGSIGGNVTNQEIVEI